MNICDEAPKIRQSSLMNGTTIKGYGFCVEEMIFLDMTREDYENYVHLRSLVFRMASCELMYLYFPRILREVEKLARSCDLASSFFFVVKSLHFMREEIRVKKRL